MCPGEVAPVARSCSRLPSSFVSARARAVVITALVAALSAGVVVAIAARSGGEPPPQARATPRPGAPPLALDLGVRTDAEARDLRSALGLFATGKRRRAAAIFSRYDSLEARVGRVVAIWPDGTVSGLSRLAALYPKSALVQLDRDLQFVRCRQRDARRLLAVPQSRIEDCYLIHVLFLP